MGKTRIIPNGWKKWKEQNERERRREVEERNDPRPEAGRGAIAFSLTSGRSSGLPLMLASVLVHT